VLDPSPFIAEYGVHCGPEHFRIDTRSALLVSALIDLHLLEVRSIIDNLTAQYNSTRSIRILAELRYYRHARGYLKDMRRRSLQVWRDWTLASVLPDAIDRLQGDRRHVTAVPAGDTIDGDRVADRGGSGQGSGHKLGGKPVRTVNGRARGRKAHH
jgi:hypothetical protein